MKKASFTVEFMEEQEPEVFYDMEKLFKEVLDVFQESHGFVGLHRYDGCNHPGCGCVCGHQKLCPEDGPSLTSNCV